MGKYDNTAGYLYIILDDYPASKWIKVGKTKDPKKRLSDYNRNLPEDRIVFTYLSVKLYDRHEAERMLLSQLRNMQKTYREAKREWFATRGRYTARGKVGKIVSLIEDISDVYAE